MNASSDFSIRTKPQLSPYKKGDVLVLFGELFTRGYANGLVEEAEKQGMTIIRATVGRREKTGELRGLNAEETSFASDVFINVPLEAGFDLEKNSSGLSPVESLQDVKLSDWEQTKLNFSQIEESRLSGVTRFRKSVQEFLTELESKIPKGANVLFAHLMAGGVPRAKIIMPLMNRAFKGSGDRYISSEKFWNSDIGQLCALSFTEVTANTYFHLLDLSTPLREKLELSGQKVSYLAYGYHGTEILINSTYQWQTYTPYLQGWAKKSLEKISQDFSAKGVKSCVYNCPEILTNSSSIFQGVEISLYPLLQALTKENPASNEAKEIFKKCQLLLKDDVTFEKILTMTNAFFQDAEILSHCQFSNWPQHSSAVQLEKMLAVSEALYQLHKDTKNLVTSVLSEAVFKSCGYVMLHNSWAPKSPVAWINHDIVAKCLS